MATVNFVRFPKCLLLPGLVLCAVTTSHVVALEFLRNYFNLFKTWHLLSFTVNFGSKIQLLVPEVDIPIAKFLKILSHFLNIGYWRKKFKVKQN